MSRLWTTFLVVVLTALVAADVLPAPPKDTPVPVDVKNVVSAVPPETTPAPQTTTPAPQTTTPAPQTTTPAPQTTTPAPRTTTTAPTTTSAPTTPAPVTPLPPPEKGKWAYTDNKTNVSCVIVQMALQFNISYMDNNNQVKYSAFDLPSNNDTKAINGDCGNLTQFITLQWPSPNKMMNNMTLLFKKNETEGKFSLHDMTFEISNDPSYFPNDMSNASKNLNYTKDVFAVSLKRSYRCAKNEVFVVGVPSPKANSTVAIKDLQIQAFATDKGSSFGYADDCENADVPDIVPIAVGCALGGLVLIVLITYLVGRRNRQARGYLSM